MKTPISLIIDDSAPLVQVYYKHIEPPFTQDGRPILENIPNDFLFRFCDTVEKYGIRGKFSVVPNPGCYGNICESVGGFSREVLREWIDTVNSRLSGYFSFCPEILTHHLTLDLKTGKYLSETEREWSVHATEEEMTDYIAYALEIDRDAGIRCTGVTSPWDFGVHNEKNYVLGVAGAFDRVFGQKKSWYFLHEIVGEKNIRPWVEYDEGGRTVVSIPYTVGDGFWQSIDRDDDSDEYVRFIADGYISEDGKSGTIVKALDDGCFPILCTHWQSMFSNGNRVGVRALGEVAKRIENTLSDRVEWVDFDRQAELAIADGIKRPAFQIR
ncbi:MAG: hypothetical protein KBT31_02345 [Firmicutes bacterium]|nr:hypothetical protein [Candidatus Colimorpha enterica]